MQQPKPSHAERSGAPEAASIVERVNPQGKGPALIICEHASPEIPAAYGDLGLRPEDRYSHAVWDPGAHGLALKLAQALDAPLVAGRVSRLVYDCNRPPEALDAIPAKSELIEVPGNMGLDQAQRDQRCQTVYRPFCEAVQEVIAARKAQGLKTALITVHSFTPTYYGKHRAVEIGVLHDEDSRIADAMLSAATSLPHRRIERNQPYGPADGVTHSLRIHGLAQGLANVMLEVRNDLITNDNEEGIMADELLTLMRPVWPQLEAREVRHA